MQKYFKFILSVCLFGVFASMPNLIHAQQVIVNAKGERIVIFPDGSWRYFEPSDSILLQKQLQSGNSSDPNEDLSSENYSDPTLIDEASRKKVASFIIKLQNELEKTKILLVKATNEKFNAEAKLKQAQENKKLIEPDLMEGLEMAYESQINEVKTIKKLHSGLEKIYAKSIPLQDMKFSKRERSYAKLAAEYSVLTNSPMDVSEYKSEKIKPRKKDNPIVKADKLPETKKPKSEKIDKGQNKKERIKKDKSKVDRANLDGNQPKLKRDKIEKVKTDRAARAERNNIPGRSLEKPTKVKRPKPNDVDSKHYAEKYKSKPYSCEIVEDILDDVTRQRRIVLSSVTIFTHTDDELRPYFRDKDLLKCSANLSQISGYKYLTMRFRISSSNARRNFGMLQENSLLRLKLIDGSFLNFLNIQTDRGRIDNYTGDTIFTGYYALGKSAEQALLKSEVDKVRVVWSTGYEDYEIYELNFFIDQINCLNNK